MLFAAYAVMVAYAAVVAGGKNSRKVPGHT
jgi:hypothetical protein